MRLNGDVRFVRWPAETSLRDYCREQGIPRLLVVEGGAQAPFCTDSAEDWVRAPVSRGDLEARINALRYRAGDHRKPVLDQTGTLYFDNGILTVSNTQAELMRLFLARFGQVVYRHELERRLAEHTSSPTRNSLDLHIMRLRRRIAALGLVIRTARGRGYLLEGRSVDWSPDVWRPAHPPAADAAVSSPWR